jgi:catechol-2,3-dioxygenase
VRRRPSCSTRLRPGVEDTVDINAATAAEVAAVPPFVPVATREVESRMGVNRLDHAAILVHDVGEALVWYADVLGLKALERAGDHAHLSCGAITPI